MSQPAVNDSPGPGGQTMGEDLRRGTVAEVPQGGATVIRFPLERVESTDAKRARSLGFGDFADVLGHRSIEEFWVDLQTTAQDQLPDQNPSPSP